MICRWWEVWPDANVGGAVPNGHVVLDVDGPEGRTQISGRHLPATVAAFTGGGGLHYWFRLPKGVAGGNRTRFLPGLDLKGLGGYVVLPPSRHPSGLAYEWAPFSGPGETEIADAPEWITEAFLEGMRDPVCGLRRDDLPKHGLPNVIEEGYRNDTLFRHACRLRARGADGSTILRELRAANMERCLPALADRELMTIAESAARYPEGSVRVDDRLLNAPALSDGAVLAGMLIAMTGGRATQEQLGALAGGVSTRTVRYWRKELVAAGLEDIASERPNRRYTLVRIDALTSGVSVGAKRQYAQIAKLAAGGTAQVGQDALASRTRASRSTVGRRTKELEAEGLVLRDGSLFDPDLGRRERCNRYRLPES
jgi:hypothetical protein